MDTPDAPESGSPQGGFPMRSRTNKQDISLRVSVHPDEDMQYPGSPLHLVLSEPLPTICSDHGLPAVEQHDTQLPFVDRRAGAEQLTFGRFLMRIVSRFWSRDRYNFDPDIVLHGAWPICPTCLSRARRFVRIGRTLSAAAAITVIALILALLQGARGLVVPLAFAAFPGWLPVGLLVIMGAFERAEIFAHARMTPDRAHVIISAHPNFVSAARPAPEAE
jgi:hypothetical protein